MSLVCVNRLLNALGEARSELTRPTHVWSLAKQLKQKAEILDINAQNSSLELEGKPGIYYFEAKFNFKEMDKLNEFGASWGKIRAKNLPIGISRYYPNRAKNHVHRLARNDYIPFYLGKRENISDRIINHLDGAKESGTYSLKLRSRPILIESITFRFSYIAFDINKASYFGVELLEARLRKLLNPIVGKQ